MRGKKITAACAGLVGMAALVAFPAGANAATFSNQTTIQAGGNSVANVYPSSINVSGLTGPITKARATLFGVNGDGTSRMQVLLVGPGGQSVVLMRERCGDVANGYTLSFDDASSAFLPGAGTECQSGTFKPTDNDPNDNSFTAPAPAKPYGSTMSVFNNTQANGAWRLFIEDDVIGGNPVHTIGGGWSLDIDTQTPAEAAKEQAAGKKKKCAKRKGKKGKGGKKKKCRKGKKKK
jgi:hypothetical protein